MVHRLHAWQPDVSCALGTQQPGSGVTHNLATAAAHDWTTTGPQCQCHFLGVLGSCQRYWACFINILTFYIKIAHCLVPAPFRHPLSLPDQLAMHPQRAPSGPHQGAQQSGPRTLLRQTSSYRMAGGRSARKAGGRARLRPGDAISMQPTRNGLARPRCNGAIPSSDSGMCSSAGLYLLFLSRECS